MFCSWKASWRISSPACASLMEQVPPGWMLASSVLWTWQQALVSWGSLKLPCLEVVPPAVAIGPSAAVPPPPVKAGFVALSGSEASTFLDQEDHRPGDGRRFFRRGPGSGKLDHRGDVRYASRPCWWRCGRPQGSDDHDRLWARRWTSVERDIANLPTVMGRDFTSTSAPQRTCRWRARRGSPGSVPSIGVKARHPF